MPQNGGNTIQSEPHDRASEMWAQERAAIQARIDEAIHLAMTSPRDA